MFIDVDNFKVVNDQFGHRAGDTVLQQVAARLMEMVRTEDLVARIGGDEFVVITSMTATGPGTLELAERIERSRSSDEPALGRDARDHGEYRRRLCGGM